MATDESTDKSTTWQTFIERLRQSPGPRYNHPWRNCMDRELWEAYLSQERRQWTHDMNDQPRANVNHGMVARRLLGLRNQAISMLTQDREPIPRWLLETPEYLLERETCTH